MAENVKRLNVTVPLEQLERIKQVMADDPSAYPSVSAFVGAAIADRLADAEAHRMLVAILRDLGGEPTDEDKSWAEQALRAADQAAADHSAKIQGVA